jgi:TolA-binding protein
VLSDTEKQHLVDVVAQATRDGLPEVSPDELEAGWQKLERSLSAGKYPSVPIVRGYVTPWYLRGIVFVSMILGVGIVADWRQYQREMTPLAPLRFVLEGTSVGTEQTIEAPADAPAQLVFSDRSRVSLSPKTKMAVVAMDSHGARVALAGGDLEVSVTRREGSSWRFEAGPFTVAVKGTSFHLGFEAARGRLALQMHEGSVEVRGPSQDRRLVLGAGESIELFAAVPADGRQAPAAAVGKLAMLDPTPTHQSTEPAAAPLPARPLPHRAKSKGDDNLPESQPDPSWSKLIARGEFAAVIKDATDRGLDVTLAQASAAELTALADAARYTRRNDVARQALVRLRARFPGSGRSSEAAFFLGRLAETDPTSTSAQAALAWYETYLHESAQGPYAAEALGREITLLSPTDRTRARAAARQYLERFPHGSQADLARSHLQSPAESP